MKPNVEEIRLDRVYHRRFSAITEYRRRIWEELCHTFFSRFIGPKDVVLDLGSGYGEFINAIHCQKKYAMDLNPDAEHFINQDTSFFNQDCSSRWGIDDGVLDVVFTSNFIEHLSSKEALNRTLTEAKRCLKKGGKFIALGPNIRYLHGDYWNFFDHNIPLSDLSLGEALEIHGFTMTKSIPKFLPYTMADKQPPLTFLKLYIRFPCIWPIFGRQFLIVAVSGL